VFGGVESNSSEHIGGVSPNSHDNIVYQRKRQELFEVTPLNCSEEFEVTPLNCLEEFEVTPLNCSEEFEVTLSISNLDCNTKYLMTFVFPSET
jgi:hypothetical protein